MFLDRMFSYNFSSMPLYFSEKLMSIQIDLPWFSLRSPCEDSVSPTKGDSGSYGSMYQRLGANYDLHFSSSAYSFLVIARKLSKT